jgi:hypothetical protein
VSWLNFGGQLREEGHIAVELLRQTTDNCLGLDHLAVDHLKQIYRVHAQLRTELEYICTPVHAKVSDVGAEPVWFRGHGHGGSIKGASQGRVCFGRRGSDWAEVGPYTDSTTTEGTRRRPGGWVGPDAIGSLAG